MSWTIVFCSLSGGILTAILAARLMDRKARQTAQPPTPQKVEVDVVVRTSSLPSLCPCWCPFCDASEEDIEHSQKLEELALRLAALYDASDESDSDALVVNQRHMEFMRYLVQSGRLTEDL